MQGKSLIIAGIVNKLLATLPKPKRESECQIVILQPNKELLEQNSDKLAWYGIDNIAVMSASLNRKEAGRVTMATIGTIKSHSPVFQHVKYVLIDEADAVALTSSSQYVKWLQEVGYPPVLGLTATPYKLRSETLREHGQVFVQSAISLLNRFPPIKFNHKDTFFWGKIIYHYELADLMRDKYLAPIKYYSEMPKATLRLNSTGADYIMDDIETFAVNSWNRILHVVMGALTKHPNRILVFCPSVKSAEIICEELQARKVQAEWVCGATPKKERTDKINRFKSGECKVMLNCMCLTAGFDLPELDCIIYARPTLSPRVWIQACYTKDMEILTPNGFVPIDSLKKGDDMYAFDIKTSEIKNVPVLETINRPLAKGEKVYRYKSDMSGVDVSMTDTHDLVLKCRRGKSWKKEMLREALKRKDMYWIPVAGYQKPDGKCKLNKDECMLIGWWLSDGTYDKSNNSYKICQSMTNLKFVEEIRDMLVRLNIGFNEHRVKHTGDLAKYNDNIIFGFSSKTQKEGKIGIGYLKEWLDKSGSPLLETMNQQQILWLLDGYYHGNGINKTTRDYTVRTKKAIFGQNKELVEKLQSLLTRRGIKSTISIAKGRDMVWNGKTIHQKNQYILGWRNSDYVTMNGSNVKNGSISGKKTYTRARWTEQEYHDNVYCVRNELGTTIMRRNGKIIIAGNCGRGVRLDSSNPDKVLTVYDLVGLCSTIGPVEQIKLRLDRRPNELWSRRGRIDNRSLSKFALKPKLITPPVLNTTLDATGSRVSNDSVKIV